MPELGGERPTIHLEGRGQCFTVAVRPCPDYLPSVEKFGAYIEARTHARGLRRVYGFKLSDDVDAATRRRAEEAEQARIEAKRYGRMR